VQRCRIEVGPAGPYERPSLGIEADRIELAEIPQRAEQGTMKYRLEVDDLLDSVLK
jgi:hypothetical protein